VDGLRFWCDLKADDLGIYALILTVPNLGEESLDRNLCISP